MDIEENLSTWNDADLWHAQGENWSKPWGSSGDQWFVSILPRIRRYLPATNILEIGCGYGRWTQFLRDHCERLVAVDLSNVGIENCRRRFPKDERLQLHRNDGRTFPMIEDGSIDFCFSFDSLVHADDDVMKSYVAQLACKLRIGAYALIHHSNLGAYVFRRLRTSLVIPTCAGAVRGVGVMPRNYHWRDPTVSARSIRALAQSNGLRCIWQELIDWRDCGLLLDCISLLQRQENAAESRTLVVRNPDFMREAKLGRQLFDLQSGRL